MTVALALTRLLASILGASRRCFGRRISQCGIGTGVGYLDRHFLGRRVGWLLIVVGVVLIAFVGVLLASM
jgi:hypothetical protein